MTSRKVDNTTLLGFVNFKSTLDTPENHALIQRGIQAMRGTPHISPNPKQGITSRLGELTHQSMLNYKLQESRAINEALNPSRWVSSVRNMIR